MRVVESVSMLPLNEVTLTLVGCYEKGMKEREERERGRITKVFL